MITIIIKYGFLMCCCLLMLAYNNNSQGLWPSACQITNMPALCSFQKSKWLFKAPGCIPRGPIPPEVQCPQRLVRALEFSYVSICTWGMPLFVVTVFESEVLRRVHFVVRPHCQRRFDTFLVYGFFLFLFALLLRAIRLDRRFPVLGDFFAPWWFVVFLVSTGLAARKTCSTLCL